MSAAPKYAPAREDGTKPFVVVAASWGRTTERLVYVRKRSDARYAAIGREKYTSAQSIRRATPDDVERLREYR